MARRSLRPHLNQIRGWVRQGRTDAWIAHQLEVTVQQIEAFKKENDLVPDGDGDGALVTGAGGGDFDDEIDLRAEDDALIAAELDAEPEDDEDEDQGEGEGEDEDGDEGKSDNGGAGDRPRRRRGRRGGRGRRRRPKTLEGSFDHGEEGYGLWLDPSIQEDSVYAEHWAGHRPVTVSVEPDRIVIRRAGEDTPGDNGDSGSEKLDPDEYAA
jgi:hypothetical protein